MISSIRESGSDALQKQYSVLMHHFRCSLTWKGTFVCVWKMYNDVSKGKYHALNSFAAFWNWSFEFNPDLGVEVRSKMSESHCIL